MPLPEDFNHAQFLHDNRDVIKSKLDKLKKQRAKEPKTRKNAAVVFLAGVSQRAPYKVTDSSSGEVKAVFPEPEVEIFEFKVGGGHKKPTSIRNMMRQGKFPVDYDFPTDADLAKLRADAAKLEGTLNRNMASLLLEEDPYREIRNYVETQINHLMSDWKIADGETKVSGLEAQLAEKEARAKEQEEQIAALKAKLNENKESSKRKGVKSDAGTSQ